MNPDTHNRLVVIAVVLAVAVTIVFTVRVVRGEVTSCRDDPGREGRWIYRVIDGHRCYFEAKGLARGREKPRDELAWPAYANPPAMEITAPQRSPSEDVLWQHEERFRGGGAKPGWEHHE